MVDSDGDVALIIESLPLGNSFEDVGEVVDQLSEGDGQPLLLGRSGAALSTALRETGQVAETKPDNDMGGLTVRAITLYMHFCFYRPLLHNMYMYRNMYMYNQLRLYSWSGNNLLDHVSTSS